jgi:broad specificity phosphatase PhoE
VTRDELDRIRLEHLDHPDPAGESWCQATHRVKRFLDDLELRWPSSRVLVIGHLATRWGLEHYLNGVPLEHLVRSQLTWQAGWEYSLP